MTKYFMPYETGHKAQLNAEPAVQKNLYHRRFHGRTGTIIAKRGDCYEVKIKDGNKEKVIIVHPVHLKKLAGLKKKETVKPVAKKTTKKVAKKTDKKAKK